VRPRVACTLQRSCSAVVNADGVRLAARLRSSRVSASPVKGEASGQGARLPAARGIQAPGQHRAAQRPRGVVGAEARRAVHEQRGARAAGRRQRDVRHQRVQHHRRRHLPARHSRAAQQGVHPTLTPPAQCPPPARPAPPAPPPADAAPPRGSAGGAPYPNPCRSSASASSATGTATCGPGAATQLSIGRTLPWPPAGTLGVAGRSPCECQASPLR